MINSPQKLFYIILVADIGLLAISGLLIWQIEEKKGDLTDLITQTSLIKSPEQGLLTGAGNKLESQLAILNSYFLSASTTVEFLERLEHIASLTKTTLKINQAEANDNLRLNFSVQGNFSALNQFLMLLEKLPYALRLDRLDWRAGDNNSWRGDFVITVATS